VDRERGAFKLDPLGWLFSLGRRPFRRPLPAQAQTLPVQHLRGAVKKLEVVHLTGPDRERLAALLHSALEQTSRRLRDHFRPVLATALDRVGLEPANLPERVARDKLVEELLDRLCARGLLTLGDLRDAVSRNQLKLPDLGGPVELATGDPLLRLDRRLGEALDGVYRPGEVYLRALQRLSSLAFGSRPGRLLTRFVLLPFGLAFVAIKGIGLLLEEGMHGLEALRLLGHEPTPLDQLDPEVRAVFAGHDFGEAAEHTATHFQLTNLWSVGLLGVFLVLLFNVPPFRRQVFAALKLAGRGLRAAFVGFPVWLASRPAVRAVLTSAPVTFFLRHLLVPLLLAAVSGLVALLLGAAAMTAAAVALGVFVVCLLLLSSPFGRDLQETVVYGIGRLWEWLSVNLLLGLFWLVMEVSRRFLEGVERILYRVDEWLRFRSGESRASLVVKTVAAPLWRGAAYVARIYTNLLIEPTVNPIKHFPVVTVGHKLMLPFLLVLYQFLLEQLGFLGPVLGRGFVVVTIFFLPGICGFLVWELKENWRLYRANRAAVLRPVIVGSHGETVLRLLRPGFHSGTVPKLYRKLRKARRQHDHAAEHRAGEGLHHVEEEVRHLVEREFLHLLAQSRSWGGQRLELRRVGLSGNRIRLELACHELDEESLVVVFDHCAGWLVAGIEHPGWLGRLAEGQRQALRAALAGLYKLAGVDLVREQVGAAFAPARVHFEVAAAGLVVRPESGGAAVYALDDQRVLRAAGAAMPALESARLLFGGVPLPWAAWVEAWERDQVGKGLPANFLAGVPLLPPARLPRWPTGPIAQNP
jgi:hypothetical protein